MTVDIPCLLKVVDGLDNGGFARLNPVGDVVQRRTTGIASALGITMDQSEDQELVTLQVKVRDHLRLNQYVVVLLHVYNLILNLSAS